MPFHVKALLETDKDLEGKLVTVLGLGVSGRAAIKLALARGAHVVGIDKNKSISSLQEDPRLSCQINTRLLLELGVYDQQHLRNSQRVVVSPGVSLESYNLQHLIQMGHPVVSELEFASEKLPKEVKIIAVTGTNGKSTVTIFTGQIMEQAGIPCFMGGNLGVPLSDAALHCVESPAQKPPFQVAVVEVSSYQMEIGGRNFRPSVAVVLNLTPDHLERHKTLREYGACKCRVFSHMNPSQLAVIPANDMLLRELAAQSGDHSTRAWLGDLPGVQLDDTGAYAMIHVPTTSQEARLDLTTLNTTGVHNAHNAGTAALLALGVDMGLNEDTLQSALPMLKPPPHRMQIVWKDENGVLWINDSKATNVEATYTGLKGLTKHRAVVLLGGLAKVLDKDGNIGFNKLAHVLRSHRAVVTFGASAEQIKKDLEEEGLTIPCNQSKGLVEAVELAKSFVQHGDAIVLSPGCASFDEFHNFEDRGQVFSSLAKQSTS